MNYKQSGDVFAERTDQELMLLEINTNEMYRSNSIGAFIWERLDGSHTVEEIVADLLEACTGVQEERVWKDVWSFLQALKEKRLIQEVEALSQAD